MTSSRSDNSSSSDSSNSISNSSTTPNTSNSSYPLHKAVFDDQPELLKSLLTSSSTVAATASDTTTDATTDTNTPSSSSINADALLPKNQQDWFGNTPLHLAIMLNRQACADVLIDAGVSLSIKNKDSWTPLEEAISLGDRDLLRKLLKLHRTLEREKSKKRTPMLLKQINQFGDFYLQIKWEFHSWIPLASRLLPNDICKIYKRGANIRLDSTLVDFSDMKWQRGNISYIFQCGEDGEDTITTLFHDERTYLKLDKDVEDETLETELDMLMSSDIGTVSMPTKNIGFTRAKSGIWGWRKDRTDTIGNYEARVYSVNNLNLIIKKRREHLSKEDLQQNRELLKQLKGNSASVNSSTEKLEDGSDDVEDKDKDKDQDKDEYEEKTAEDEKNKTNTDGNKEATEDQDEDYLPEIKHRPSLPPPPPCTVTWEEYSAAAAAISERAPALGRPIVVKNTTKAFSPTIWMCDDFPLSTDEVIKLLEILAPTHKHLGKLKQFVATKLPSGFPIKVELPVFPTVTAQVTFLEYEGGEQSEDLFYIPQGYTEKVQDD